MERAQKEEQVGTIKDRFDRMVSVVLVDFKGLTVEQVTKLRDDFRSAGVEYRVCKNSLVRHAISGNAWADTVGSSLVGMTGFAWSYEDPSAAAKIIRAFRKEKQNAKLTVKVGIVDGQVISATDVENTLATMPGKDELRAKLLATFQAPAQQFVAQLNAPVQNFVYLLAARKEQQ